MFSTGKDHPGLIVVHLHTVLQRFTPQGRVGKVEVAWTPGLSLAGLVYTLGFEVDPDNTLIVVNGQVREMDFGLNEGDEVHLIPAISGG